MRLPDEQPASQPPVDTGYTQSNVSHDDKQDSDAQDLSWKSQYAHSRPVKALRHQGHTPWTWRLALELPRTPPPIPVQRYNPEAAIHSIPTPEYDLPPTPPSVPIRGPPDNVSAHLMSAVSSSSSIHASKAETTDETATPAGGGASHSVTCAPFPGRDDSGSESDSEGANPFLDPRYHTAQYYSQCHREGNTAVAEAYFEQRGC